MLKKTDIEKFINDVIGLKIKSDIVDNDLNYIVYCEVPGIKKENISVEYSNGILTILTADDTKYENLIKSERSNGLQIRNFNIPNIDILNSSASLNDGILKITLPKINAKNEHFKININ